MKAKTCSVFVVAMLLLVATVTDLYAQSAFPQLQFPSGIEVYPNGNVYVYSDFTFTTRVTKFAPDGTPVGETGDIGGITAAGGGALARDPLQNGLFLLKGSEILLIGPDLGVSLFLDLNPISFQVFEALEMTTGTVQSENFGTPSWGDMAIGRPSDSVMDLFLSGTVAQGGFPFVMRIRVDFLAGTFVPTVMAFSKATFGAIEGGPNQPRGVAVSPQGLVLTTLLVPSGGTFQNVAVAMGAEYPENPAFPPTVLLGGIDLISRGMTADAAGNFYIAPGRIGSSLCNLKGNGGIVVLSRTLDQTSCLNVGPDASGLSGSKDVAVDPRDGSVLAVFDEGHVLRFFPTVVSGDVGPGDPVPPVVPAPPGQPAPPVSPSPPAFTCLGRPATIVGTEGNDRIRGTNRNDVIVGLGGKDKINGRGGNDRICGEAGNDLIKGGRGNDRLQGGRGSDLIIGGTGRDRCSGERVRGC